MHHIWNIHNSFLLCSQREDDLPNLKGRLLSTIIHHHYWEVSYTGLTIGLIIRNCYTSLQCDNGLNGHSGNVLCMATSVTQVEISYSVWTKFEGNITYIFMGTAITHHVQWSCIHKHLYQPTQLCLCKNFIEAICDLVGRHSKKNHNNCAFCDKSTEFGICVKKYIISRFEYWAIKNCTSGSYGNQF